jgi:SAM-dependent methyltransferase
MQIDERLLQGVFGNTAPDHFDWQTRSPFVSDRERDLVRAAFLPLGERVLDVGCGQGATLHHLGAGKGAVGLDLFDEPLAFARRHLPDVEFVRGSAYDLPFEAESFDHVLVRDVIHHLERPARLIEEAARVLRPGGRLDVLETCGLNPLIALHALTRPEERGELRSNARYLAALLRPHFDVRAVEHHQAMPVHRLIFHPQFGSASRAHAPRWRAAVDRVERAFERILPRWAWAYVHVRAARPARPIE